MIDPDKHSDPQWQQWLFDCIEAVCRAHDELDEAKGPISAAYAMTTLNDRLSDLRSYHPGFDVETGTMPYDREVEE